VPPIVVDGVTLPSYADPADVPAAMRAMVNGLLSKAGGAMVGILDMGGNRVMNVGTPVGEADAAHKSYVDAAVANVTWATIQGKPTSFPPATHAHTTADYWTTARTLSLTGDVTGSVSVRGNANMSLATTVANDSHTHDTRYYTEGQVNNLLAGYLKLTGNNNTQVAGTIVFPGTIYVNKMEVNELIQTSSVAVKERIGTVDLRDNIFDRINPIAFHYREGKGLNTSFGRMGFSYEQMLEVAPEWTVKTDETKAINYWGMLPDFMAWATTALRLLLAERDES
jgi:hypothetical protein